MNEEDLKLFEKFKIAISSGLDDVGAVDFLSKLSPDDYDCLIHMFNNNDFPSIKSETKEKILVILNKLKASI